MGRKLATTVHVHRVEDGTYVETAIFGPGEELPDWAAAVVGDHVYASDEDEPSKEGVVKPAGNASLEAWQDYALDQGKTRDEIEGKTRDELRDQFNS